MKAIFILFLLCSTLASAAQLTPGKYQVFTGNVGETDATLHLQITGDKVFGYMWFAKTPMPMFCYTEYNPAKDSLIINANANPLSVTLSGLLKGNSFSGSSTLQKNNSDGKNATFNMNVSSDTFYTNFSVVSQKASLKMPPRLPNESTGNYFGSAIWPANLANKRLETTLKATISKMLGNKPGSNDAPALLLTEKNKFVADWNATNAKLKPADTKEMGLSLSQELQHRVGVVYEDARVIALYNFSYSFTGGAHGNYITTISNVNKQTGSQVKLTDVLTSDGIKALPAILEQVVRTQYNFDKAKSLEENGLFVKTVVPSANFYIANGNLGFLYSTYSILPYAYGEPNLFVPASAIARFVKPAYRQL